jgi:hypothetical protein
MEKQVNPPIRQIPVRSGFDGSRKAPQYVVTLRNRATSAQIIALSKYLLPLGSTVQYRTAVQIMYKYFLHIFYHTFVLAHVRSVKKIVYIPSPTNKQTAILIDKASLILSHKRKYIILRKL